MQVPEQSFPRVRRAMKVGAAASIDPNKSRLRFFAQDLRFEEYEAGVYELLKVR